MEFDLFIEEISKYIETRMGDEFTVSVNQVIKNNDIHLSGLCIRRKGCNAAPTIYMNYYYDQFMKGTEMSQIGDSIIELYGNCELKEDFESDFYTDYSKVEPRLMCRLINYDRNRELLEDVPYERFYDLAIVPYYLMESKQLGNSSILVKNSHLEMWHISAEECLKSAVENTAINSNFEMTDIREVLGNAKELENCPFDFDNVEHIMYVATNKRRMFGASIMCIADKLREIGEQLEDDYFILPSSIHEVIIVPRKQAGDMYSLNMMIKEINDNYVEEEEILSDHAYMYSNREQVLIF